MELLEILDRIEEIIKDKELETGPEEEATEPAEEQPAKRNALKEIIYLILSFILNLLKAPYRVIARYLKNEIINTIKRDAKLYGAIIGMVGILFLLFTVLWLFISIAVGAYYYDQGEPLFVAVLYSIGFQVICILLISLIAYITSRNIKSVKLIKNLPKAKD